MVCIGIRTHYNVKIMTILIIKLLSVIVSNTVKKLGTPPLIYNIIKIITGSLNIFFLGSNIFKGLKIIKS